METSEARYTDTGDNASSSGPTGYLLGKLGLLILAGGLLVAAWYGQGVITVLIGLVLSAAGLARLWSRLSLSGVSCRRHLSERRVFPGEHIELKLRLVNRKLLPLPWIQLDDQIPPELAPDAVTAASDRAGTGFLSKSTALLWYTGVNWKERLVCNRRGYYRLGPMRLTSGDIFGFYPRSAVEPATDHIIVYPRIFPIEQLGIPSAYPLGEITAARRIFEDPLRITGVRDYSPRDSLRHIHWKATARRQELQTKVFEPTTTLKAAIFLDVDGFNYGDGRVTIEEDFELGISAAASVASYLNERRSATGLFVNSCLADSGQPAELLPGSGDGQLTAILEALAKVTPRASAPFNEFLQAERTRLSWGTTLIFIVCRSSPPLAGLLVSLKESGYKLLVLQAGDAGDNGIADGIDWHRIRRPEDLTLKAIGVKG